MKSDFPSKAELLEKYRLLYFPDRGVIPVEIVPEDPNQIEKMLSSLHTLVANIFGEESYTNHKTPEEIASIFQDLAQFINLPENQRLDISNRIRSFHIDLCSSWLTKIKTILNDPDFVQELEMDYAYLEQEKRYFENHLEYWKKKTRKSSKGLIAQQLSVVYEQLQSLEDSKPVDKIYRVLEHFGFDDYGEEHFESDTPIGKPEQLDRIRKAISSGKKALSRKPWEWELLQPE